MTHTATIDGRTLHLDGRRIALDDVSAVVTYERVATTHFKDWSQTVDQVLNVGAGCCILYAAYLLFNPGEQWLSFGALAAFGIGAWIILTVLFPFIAAHFGAARNEIRHGIRLDFADGAPARLPETSDRAFAERVATALRRVILEPAPSSGPLVIDWRKGTIEAAGATP